MNRIADGITRRNIEFPQQQYSRGGEILTMTAAGTQEEARQGRLICIGGIVLALPHTVAEVTLEELVQTLQFLGECFAGQLQFGEHLLQSGKLLRSGR